MRNYSTKWVGIEGGSANQSILTLSGTFSKIGENYWSALALRIPSISLKKKTFPLNIETRKSTIRRT